MLVSDKKDFSAEEAVFFFRQMLRIRMLEEQIADRYAEQKMRCPVHLSIGQEAIAVAVSACLNKEDQIVSTHRCHAHYLAKGGNMTSMLSEMMGRSTGCCGGRGGSMHLFDHDAGVLLSLPIVAASIPVGAGAALAFQQMGKPNVAIIYLGDASLEEGVYHETANFAALKNLPVIFICENNLYSVYTNLQDRQPNRPLTDLGRAHGLESHRVNGNNVKDVFHLASAAVEKARRGGGPSFILADTYRWREHCGPNYDNDLGYRTTEEFEAWRKTDPISCLRRDLFSKKVLDQKAEDKITQEISEEIDNAFQLAEAAPYPDAHLVGSRIYA